MTDELRDRLARRVDDAARKGETIPQLTLEHPDLTAADAYDVQRHSIALRLDRGERRVGMKMGLTSRAKMEQVGVHEPIYGRLTDAMQIVDGGTVTMAGRCHPRAEPEVAFIIGRPDDGDSIEVVGICAAIEVIDSRYENFKFSLPDVIADNTSASAFVLSPTVYHPDDVDLANLGIVFEQNGEVVATGSTAAILDHPINSLDALLAMLERDGDALQEGDIVLAGAATAATHIAAGDTIRATIDQLGAVGFVVE